MSIPSEIFARAINGQTNLLGVIGDPVHHSLSPFIHNLAAAELGLNYCYLPFHLCPDQLSVGVDGLRAIGVKGFNATIPHKEALVPLMDTLDPMAKMIAAVNTVVIHEDGRLHGYNTDAYGFTKALQACFSVSLESLSILVLGGGGAARGVLAGLLQMGAKQIFLVNRTHSKAVQLADMFNQLFPGALITPIVWAADQLPLSQCQLVVNTTSLGLKAEESSLLDLALLPKQALVYDIVYSPLMTPLLSAAKEQGLQVENGLGMLIHQGARAFEIWTGEKMPVTKIKTQLYDLLTF